MQQIFKQFKLNRQEKVKKAKIEALKEEVDSAHDRPQTPTHKNYNDVLYNKYVSRLVDNAC